MKIPSCWVPHEIVTRLGTIEAGLYQLARAANAFRPDQAALNSFSARDFAAGLGADTRTYIVPWVDADNPAQVRRDGSGALEPLTQYRLFAIADPEETRKAETAAQDELDATGAAPTPAARADRLRTALFDGLVHVDTALSSLLTLIAANGEAPGDMVADHDTWTRLNQLSGSIMARINVNEPRPAAEDTPFGTDEDDEDADEDPAKDTES